MSGKRFDRREGERLGDYIARLEGVRVAGLSDREWKVWADSLTAARIARALEERREKSPLERCKEAVRDLSPADRERLARWLAGGMRE
jgi:hypothetical protein